MTIVFLIDIKSIASYENNILIKNGKKPSCLEDDTAHLSGKYYSNKIGKEEEHEQMKILYSIKYSCGELCSTSDYIVSNSHLKTINLRDVSFQDREILNPLKKCVNCRKIWQNQLLDQSSGLCSPVRNISQKLMDLFTYHGTIEIDFIYYNDVQSSYTDTKLEVRAR